MRNFGRSLRNRRMLSRSDATSITYTKDEPYSICYYLYVLFENLGNNNIISDYYEGIKAFLEAVEKLNKKERLRKVLESEIAHLEKQKLLVPIKEPVTEEMYFDDSDVPFFYEQDRRIDRSIRHYGTLSDLGINIHRILFTSTIPVFSSLINTVVFRDTEDLSLCSELKLTKNLQKSIFNISKTKFLVDQVQLSPEEALYVLFLCRFNTSRDLNRIGNNFGNEMRNFLPDLLNMSSADFAHMVRSDQKLKSFDFIDNDGDYNPFLNECIEIQSIEPYFSDLLRPIDCSSAYSKETFAVPQDSVDICADLLKGDNPVSILFYGKPGSGKTELAKTICKETGKKTYVFKNESETENRNLLGKLVCLLSMERKDSVLIVDEADSLISTLEFSFFGATPSRRKGTINKMLEENKDKVIYIINHQRQIDESTLRRFTFSIKFEAMPATQLRSIAKTKIEPMELSENTKQQILDMFDKYRLTGQSVDNIVKTIEGMECKKEETLLKKVQVVMKENSLLINGKSKVRNMVKAEYDPTVLNASMNPLQIIDMVQNAAKFAEKNKGTENGIRMLFYGLSGTGKTELARYLAEKLGKPLLMKRASDILGMYVGQNEQNIRDAFAEAEASDSILLFDEADSFFYDRNQAQRSWERSTVNEFLTQMEEFSGILICTTNLRNIMDPAMQRRFHIMVEFKPMKFDGIKTMLEKYFPAYHISNREIEELEDCQSVTPGDFGVLSSRIRFMNQDIVNSEYILNELKKLQDEKKNQWHQEGNESRRIGFSA